MRVLFLWAEASREASAEGDRRSPPSVGDPFVRGAVTPPPAADGPAAARKIMPDRGIIVLHASSDSDSEEGTGIGPSAALLLLGGQWWPPAGSRHINSRPCFFLSSTVSVQGRLRELGVFDPNHLEP